MVDKRTQLVKGEIYHVVIRAVDGINLFRDRKDYLRMIHDLFEFNDLNPVSSVFRTSNYRQNPNVTTSEVVTLKEREEKKKRKLLVEILLFCLMPNHIHLLLRQIQDNGISRFMHKLGGYVLYYNKKYERKGHLYQGKFQAVLIKNNEQLKTVFVYVHTNPTAIIFPGWKEKGITDLNQAIKFIENYRWSSYSDYLGKKNFPSLTSREFLTKVMGGPAKCKEFVDGWLEFKRELADFDYIAIE